MNWSIIPAWFNESITNRQLLSISIVILAIITTAVDQLRYKYITRKSAGPRWTIPFIGSLISMVRSPYDFWHAHFESAGISMDWLLGRPLAVSSNAATSRDIFRNCNERLPLALHPNADLLLAKNNLAFMNGDGHTELRQQLSPLFKPTRLAYYATIQQAKIRRFLADWSSLAGKNGGNLEIKENAFSMNISTSLQVFVGPYIDDDMQTVLQSAYRTLTKGFLSWPINLPGTALNQASAARQQIIKRLTNIAGRSRLFMQQPKAEPRCVVDYWMIDAIGDGKLDRNNNYDVACVLLDFLFAAQDASTSSLTWSAHYLAKRPDVRKRVRTELATVRNTRYMAGVYTEDLKINDIPESKRGGPIDLDMLAQMPFTKSVVQELLRVRPPATIVPHVVRGTPLDLPAGQTIDNQTDEKTAFDDKPAVSRSWPKSTGSSETTVSLPVGTIVCPSIWSANREGVHNAEAFDPDRVADPANFLTFGDGRHRCLGQQYARNHLMLFVALLAEGYDFDRLATADADRIVYGPTLYPADGCRLSNFRPRV